MLLLFYFQVNIKKGDENMYKFNFSCVDNGGKRQSFTVKANNKMAAIDAGLKRARKNAAGDIYGWTCKLLAFQ